VQNKEEVCAILNINLKALTEKYLGLPAQVGMDRTDCFQYLVDRVCQIISGWNKKNLSMGGKEILLKAVAQAIPSYAMSMFKLAKGICKAISADVAHFWWGEKDGKKCMHWYSRWKLCTPKKQGGWVLGTYIVSTLRCWENRFGDWRMNQNLCVPKY
jgi:hypothetical protein